MAVALAAYSLVVFTLQLWRRVRSRSRQLSAHDAVFLGERWLPLMHPEDEPINVLRASVIQPAEPFMPRLKAGLGAREAGKFESVRENEPAGRKPVSPPITLSTVITAAVSLVTAPFYNRIVAPMLDQFLWETVKQVAQGKDIAGEYLIRCDRAPPELLAYWKEGPPDFLAKLSTLADSSAACTARSIRSRLAAIGEGTSSVSALSNALSWREVVHTAYFEPGCGVAAIVAQRIIQNGVIVGAARPTPSAPAAEPASRKQRPFRPRYLYLALVGAAAAFCAAASLSTVAVERAWLWPYTNAFQIDRIYRSLFEARATSLRLMHGLDKILIRWVLLDRTEEAIITALRLDDMIRYMGANAGNRATAGRRLRHWRERLGDGSRSSPWQRRLREERSLLPRGSEQEGSDCISPGARGCWRKGSGKRLPAHSGEAARGDRVRSEPGYLVVGISRPRDAAFGCLRIGGALRRE